jgi:hypothetical protein
MNGNLVDAQSVTPGEGQQFRVEEPTVIDDPGDEVSSNR